MTDIIANIAEHPGITNAKHVSLLPPSWGTLHALTKLPCDEFERRIADAASAPQRRCAGGCGKGQSKM
jgi:hypothetical protein